MASWLKLYRKFQCHPFWHEKRVYSRAEAWLDILMTANYEDRKEIVKGKIFQYKRGTWNTSELKLCDRWRWSRNKVRAYLTLLEHEEMITRKGTIDGTALTIVNYDVYQGKGTANDTAEGTVEGTTESTAQGTTEGTQTKNIKKDKKYIITSYTDNAELIEAINNFIDMRKKIKSEITDNGLSLALNRLDKLASNDTDKIAILNQSIMNSWKGVFKLKMEVNNANRNGGNAKPRFGATPTRTDWRNEPDHL